MSVLLNFIMSICRIDSSLCVCCSNNFNFCCFFNCIFFNSIQFCLCLSFSLCLSVCLSLCEFTGTASSTANTSKAEEKLAQITEPVSLCGPIERRSGGFSLSSPWKEIMAEVKSPGYLHLYKDKKVFDAYNANTGGGEY